MKISIPPLLSNCLALFAIYYLFLPAPAYGYFDLGTGTYIVQMLLGFGAAVWLSMRTTWVRFDRKKKSTSPSTAPVNAQTSATGPATAADASAGSALSQSNGEEPAKGET